MIRFRICAFLFMLGCWLSTSGQGHTIYLVGDAGEPYENGNPVIKQIKEHLSKDDTPNSIIYLGDNIYPNGLPAPSNPDRPRAQEIISSQLEIFEDFRGQVFVIPGNHDWDKGKKDGFSQIRNQEAFVDEFLTTILKDSVNAFLPDGGCPGPIEINLSDEVTLVIIDTQWLLHPWKKPREYDGCDPGTYQDVFATLEEMVRRNDHKKVIVAAHHPAYSYGILSLIHI